MDPVSAVSISIETLQMAEHASRSLKYAVTLRNSRDAPVAVHELHNQLESLLSTINAVKGQDINDEQLADVFRYLEDLLKDIDTLFSRRRLSIFAITAIRRTRRMNVRTSTDTTVATASGIVQLCRLNTEAVRRPVKSIRNNARPSPTQDCEIRRRDVPLRVRGEACLPP